MQKGRYVFRRYVVHVSFQPQIAIVGKQDYIALQAYWLICNQKIQDNQLKSNVFLKISNITEQQILCSNNGGP
jgi:hypothetical protein